MRSYFLSLTAIGLTTSGLPAADWPQVLGPDRNGVIVNEKIVPPTGDQKLKTLWRANVGHGVSPVVVAGGRVTEVLEVGTATVKGIRS